MFGYSTQRETWKPQWGPEPMLALYRDEDRAAPITLPGRDGAKRRFAGLSRR